MDFNDVKNRLLAAKPGAWAVKVTYIQPIEFSKRAIKQGRCAEFDFKRCCRMTTRLCRVNIKYSHTKYAKEREAQGHKLTHQPPKGMKGPTDHTEDYLFWYSIKNNNPYMIIHQTKMLDFPVATKNSYFINGEEVGENDIVDLYDQGLITAVNLVGGSTRPYSIIPCTKIINLEVTGYVEPDKFELSSADPEYEGEIINYNDEIISGHDITIYNQD